METYRPALEAWASNFSTEGEMSHRDLIQEAWLQIWKGLGSFRGVDDAEHVGPVFFRWLKVTARNAMLTTVKHRQAQCRSPDQPVMGNGHWNLPDDAMKTPSSIVALDEEIVRMRIALSELPDPLDRQIFSMVTDDGFSLRLISDLLGRDYSTIRRRFHLGLGTLEHLLNPP